MARPGTTPTHSTAVYQPLVIVLLFAAAGVVFDRYLPLPLLAHLVLAICLALAWWPLWRRGVPKCGLAILMSLSATAAAWHHCQWSLFPHDEIGRFARLSPAPACLEAIALTAPRRVPPPQPDSMQAYQTGERSRLEIRIVAIRDADAWRNTSGDSLLLVDGQLLGIAAGDRLRLCGQIAAPHGPENPGEFDFAAHARADRHLATVRCDVPECVRKLAPGSPWSFGGLVDRLRRQGDDLLHQFLPEDRGNLASAMFLGLREELQVEQSQAYMETGTIHLLVISGLNVAILARCLYLLLRAGLVPATWKLVALGLVTLLYAIVTDFQPPVVRATVMVIVVCIASLLGRRSLNFNTLAAAALLVLAYNPGELFRAGTQLSFLSVAAIICVAQAARKPLYADPLDYLIAKSQNWPRRAIRQASLITWQTLWVSIVVWLVIAPLVMARFHLVSPVAVLLGPVLGLPVAIAMSAGFGVMLLGWLVPPLGAVCGWVCDACLRFLQFAVGSGRDLPLSHRWVAGPGDWWLAGFYLLLACWAFLPQWRPPRRWCLTLLGVWTAIGLGASAVDSRPAERLECAFLSVGHGTAVVLHTPAGQTLLYDAGRLGAPPIAARSVASYLWSQGITHLDGVIISHADADHYNALPQLLRQFSVSAVYVSPVMFDGPSRTVAALHEAIDKSGVPIKELWSGDRISAGEGCKIEVLHPPQRGVLGTDNANSIVLNIEYQGRRVLLTGDLESPGLDDLLAEAPLDVDVLLAPHHGSAYSDPPGIAQWSTPEYVVISGAERDDRPEVRRAYLSRGSQVLHTAALGAVQLRIERGELRIEPWHRPR